MRNFLFTVVIMLSFVIGGCGGKDKDPRDKVPFKKGDEFYYLSMTSINSPVKKGIIYRITKAEDGSFSMARENETSPGVISTISFDESGEIEEANIPNFPDVAERIIGKNIKLWLPVSKRKTGVDVPLDGYWGFSELLGGPQFPFVVKKPGKWRKWNVIEVEYKIQQMGNPVGFIKLYYEQTTGILVGTYSSMGGMPPVVLHRTNKKIPTK